MGFNSAFKGLIFPLRKLLKWLILKLECETFKKILTNGTHHKEKERKKERNKQTNKQTNKNPKKKTRRIRE